MLVAPAPVFRTVQSVGLGGRTGRTAGGSPSFFRIHGRTGANGGRTGRPVVLFCYISFDWYAQVLRAHDLTSLIVHDQANHVPYA